MFTLRHPRPTLHARIEDRVSQMFSAGLIDEVSGLLEKWTELGKTAAQAVGYREAIDHIQTDVGLEATIEKVRVRTRRFARHQETWFRGLSECQILDLDDSFDPIQTVELLLEIGHSRDIAKSDSP